jgi:hypothetical protein
MEIKKVLSECFLFINFELYLRQRFEIRLIKCTLMKQKSSFYFSETLMKTSR